MESIPQFFERYAKEHKGNPILWEKQQGLYQSINYGDFRELVHRFAAGLAQIGVKKGERVALLSEGRNDWLMSELGVLYNGAVCVPLSTKLNEDREIIFRLNHSETTTIIVSKQQYDKVNRIKPELPALRRIILLDNKGELLENEFSKEYIFRQGDEFLQDKKELFEQMWKSITPDDFANISYTSGTTSDPKGIVLTHNNYTANAEQACGLMEIPRDYIMFIVLPWDHSFAHTAGLYSLIKKGASIASVEAGKTPLETLRNIPKNMKELRPHIMLSVPAIAKRFRKNIEEGIHQKGPRAEKMYHHALKIAYDYNREGYNKKSGLQLKNRLLLKIYDKLLFQKIRENFGGRMKFFVGGGALLDIELQRFFYAIGMPMFQGYGLSESSPVISANATHAHKLGSSGKIVDNMDIVICDDNGKALPNGEKGEIVIKGPNVMHSYWKNDKATAETIKDGWLYTGDLGYIDKDHYLYVLGRYKSLLISNDGEKFSPEGIEETILEHSPFIEQMMLHNNQDPYTIALIYPNREALMRYARENEIDISGEEGKTALIHLLKEEFNKYKKNGPNGGIFPERWLPATFGILEEGFTEENKLLNSTMKMVRGRITKRYEEKINYLYSAEGKKPVNEVNLNALGNLTNNK
ncbi:MAG: AMP-binding protein [Bacteroidales bacterium]|nr:AMP-binding protein [Bacteroidales bacterium]MCF8334110.1 AMP-binding protein [Bacteroidales bacterium]